MKDRASRLRDAQATMRMLQHEVRTPLGHVIGYSEMLEEEVLDRGQEDLVEDLVRIRKAASRLLDLVDGKLRTDPTEEIARLAEREPDAEEPEAALADTASDAAPVGRGRVLIVDADVDGRGVLARRLTDEGFGVETARDGIDALRRIEEGASDLVVLDVLLPAMNGLEVLERIRRSRSLSELPVLLVSRLGASVDIVEGLDRGANDYIVKPYDLSEIVARIDSHLMAHRSASQVAALARQLEFRNAFIRQALGRHVDEDLLVELSERPDAQALGGARHTVVSLVVDIRETRTWSAGQTPDQIFTVLNNVFGPLSDIATRYGGHVDTVSGDSMVALFGLPVPAESDAERAAACALAMQLEMQEIRARNRRADLPVVEIGIGLATGEVLVGGIGRGEGLRYVAIGPPAIRAALIERAARPGEILICQATRDGAGEVLELDPTRSARLETGSGVEPLHSVLGVGGAELISLRSVPASPASGAAEGDN